MHNQSILALMPARGGSKGIPRKNLLTVQGRPLMAWTVDAALNSELIDTFVVSSDDDEIIEAAKSLGCTNIIKRPGFLATDSADSVDVVLHALEVFPSYDIVVLLQPTSPLRLTSDIEGAIQLMISRNAPSCVSVCQADLSPYWMFSVSEDDRMSSFLPIDSMPSRRQDLPATFVPNGAVYVARSSWLRDSKSFFGEGAVAYKMPHERSLDIDTIADFEAFRFQVSER
jgi:CMP-N,N'-diacetyllegionaminic acid synthase